MDCIRRTRPRHARRGSGSFVCLTTFSRGLLLALIISLLVFFILQKLSGDLWISGSDAYARRRHANHVLMILLAIEFFEILFGGTFMLDCLTTGQQNFGGHLEHWSKGIGLLKTPEDLGFGIGTGCYPVAYAREQYAESMRLPCRRHPLARRVQQPFLHAACRIRICTILHYHHWPIRNQSQYT